MISIEGVWPSVLHQEISLEPAEAVVQFQPQFFGYVREH